MLRIALAACELALLCPVFCILGVGEALPQADLLLPQAPLPGVNDSAFGNRFSFLRSQVVSPIKPKIVDEVKCQLMGWEGFFLGGGCRGGAGGWGVDNKKIIQIKPRDHLPWGTANTACVCVCVRACVRV